VHRDQRHLTARAAVAHQEIEIAIVVDIAKARGAGCEATRGFRVAASSLIMEGAHVNPKKSATVTSSHAA
jgi:hypothetical protein